MTLIVTLLCCTSLSCGGPEHATSPIPKQVVETNGVVLDPDGEPIAGAIVGLQEAEDVPPFWLGTTDSNGRFHAPTSHSAPLAVAVTSPDHPGLYLKAAPHSADRLTVRLAKPQAGFQRVAVRVVDIDEAPIADTFVRVAALGDADANIYFVRTDSKGYASASLPNVSYMIEVLDDQLVSQWEPFLPGSSSLVTLRAFTNTFLATPLSEGGVDELRAASLPAEGFRVPTKVEADLRRSQIIGLGEATHGTSEFNQWKRNFVEDLVKNHDLRVLAIEANYAESLVVDEILQSGRGDLGKALAGMHFWIWDTEEMLGTLEWLREHNKTVPANARVRFVGVDAQFTEIPTARFLEWLASVSPEAARKAVTDLGPLLQGSSAKVLARLSPEKRAATQKALDGLRETVGENVEQRQLLRTIEQAFQYSAGDFLTRNADRDRFLAENVLWVREQHAGSGKVAIWSHNAHIARSAIPFVKPMGAWLSEKIGTRYLAVGFMFLEGELRARDAMKSKMGVEELSAKRAPAHFAEAGLASVGDVVLVNLRKLGVSGQAHRWLRARRTRDAGAVFTDQLKHSLRHVVRLYDFIGFVKTSTPTHPTKTGERPPGK